MTTKGMLLPLRGKPMPYVVNESGCWIFQGGTDGRYGNTGWRRGRWKAHRRAWVEANGEIPDGMHVLHRCDVTLCINPDHLWLGTHADNMRDREAKGRGNHPPKSGICQRGHSDWYYRKDRPGKRNCRACARLTSSLL